MYVHVRIQKELLVHSCAVVPFILCNKKKIVHLLLTYWKVISAITPTSMQNGLAQGTPADSLAAATHANVQASMLLVTDPIEQTYLAQDHYLKYSFFHKAPNTPPLSMQSPWVPGQHW